MKKYVLLLAVIFIYACNNEKKRAQENTDLPVIDTLTYTYDSVKVYSKNLVKANNNLIDTTKATVKYPVFKNETLNNYIKKQVFSYISENEEVTSYQDMAASFINGYDSFYKANPKTSKWWYLLIDVKVIYQAKNYIALKRTHSDYAGGAHPTTSIFYINYNPKTNQPVTLESLIENKTELLKIAEEIFRKNENLTTTEPLIDKYFFENGKFSLPVNFYISQKGLIFLYNPYEIKPYVAGTTELIIPFAKLKPIAKPNSILTDIN